MMDYDLVEWIKMKLKRSDNTVRSEGLKHKEKETIGKEGEEELVEEHRIVKVMTDEQLEEFQKQKITFDIIYKSLQETYRRIASEFLSQHAGSIGSPSNDLLKISEGHKRSNRKKRWRATRMQKLILENIYHSGKVSPSKEDIKWITCELSQHGEITESTVYNWFQNTRAHQKRKKKIELAYNTKSEVELGIESSNAKKIKLEKKFFDDNQYLNMNAHGFQTSEVDSRMHFINQELDAAQNMNPSVCNLSLFQTSVVDSQMHCIKQEFDTAQGMNPSMYNLGPYGPRQMPFM